MPSDDTPDAAPEPQGVSRRGLFSLGISRFTPPAIDYEGLTARTREAWAEGVYSPIGRRLEDAAVALVQACAVLPGQEVLDVGAGDGNAALAAAREGAHVVASDLAPEMVDQGRRRTEAEGESIEWVVADAQDLPFEDDDFDVALSVFGAVFAPRPRRVAAELFRVVRPGGVVGLVAWSPDGFMGSFFDIADAYSPQPAGVSHPLAWGEEDIIARRFEGTADRLEVESRFLHLTFDSTRLMWNIFSTPPGPFARSVARLTPVERERLRVDFFRLVAAHNDARDGTVSLEARYTLAVARRAAGSLL